MKKVLTLIAGGILLMLNQSLRAEEMAWGIVCPPNKTIYCTSDLYNLSQHGNAYFQGHSGHIPLHNPTVNYHLNSCNIGHITRTWTYMGPNWQMYSCTQTIHVVGHHNQQPEIYWPPAIVELEGCHPNTHPTVTGRPTFGYNQCAHLGYSWRDQVFTVSDQCKKIIRRWTVIDWCVNTPQNPHVGIWYYNQTLVIADSEIPVLKCPDPVEAKADNCNNGKVTVPPLVLGQSPCGGDYIITNNSPFAFSSGADISGIYPIGKTKVKYTVQYGCGYRRSCEVEITVKDNKPPTPICINHVTVALMPVDNDKDGIPDDGMVEIRARDLNLRSTAACNRGPLRFAFSPDPADMTKIFTCDDLGENKVRMYAIDSKGNSDFCIVTVFVQNNSANIPNCKRKEDDNGGNDDDDDDETELQISGFVNRVSGLPMEGVELALGATSEMMQISISYDTIKVVRMDSMVNHSGAKLYFFFEETKIIEKSDTTILSALYKQTFTDANGKYVFDEDLILDQKYILECLKTEDTGEQVDASDADILLAHLLGTDQFTKAWQYIAADVNLDGRVNLDDLNDMLRVIMGDATDYGHDQVWIFTLTDLLDIANPSEILDIYSNLYETDSLKGPLTGINFTGIQLGKLAQSGTVSSSLQTRDSENSLSTKASVFPNPFMNELNVRLSCNSDEQALFILMDATGRQVYTQTLSLLKGDHSYSIRPDMIGVGAYVYRISINDQIQTGVIIKK